MHSWTQMLSSLKTNNTVDQALQKLINHKTKRLHVLKRIVASLMYLAEHNLVFEVAVIRCIQVIIVIFWLLWN